MGGAVTRNRVKRLLREAFRSHEASLAAGHDYVAVARADAGALAERDGLAGVARALGELITSAGAAEEAAKKADPETGVGGASGESAGTADGDS